VKRLRELARALGPAGVIGACVLFLCIPFYFAAIRPAERELSEQRLAGERLRSRSPVQPVSASGDARRLYYAFPEMERLPDELERLYGLARAANLELDRGEYRMERRGQGLASYRVTLPIRGSYPAIREFLGTTLQQMPYAAIDALRFDRKKIAETELDAQVRITLYFRPNDPIEGQ
jgi:hypothetical protein